MLGTAAANHDALALECAAADAVLATYDHRQREKWRDRQFAWYTERIDAARMRMRADPSAAHSLAGLAREAGMSPFHFSRLFRELVGVPPHRYLLRVRLKLAYAMIRDGMSVSRAAIAAGYDDFSHFSRLYRSFFGHRPSDDYPLPTAPEE